MESFLRALQFLTILPVASENREDKPVAALGTSAPFFPVVGALVALLSYFVFWAFSAGLPWRVSVLFLVMTPVFLTGALHVDGLGDFCDGFFSARGDRTEILRIMKDSRIGVMGVLGIFLVLIAKYELLVHLASRPSLFIFMAAASRCVQVALAYFLPYVGGPSGMGKDFGGQITRQGFSAAACVACFIGLFLGLPILIVEIFFLILFTLGFGFWVRRRVGGVTGDILGAGSELAEVCVLAVAAWMT